MLDCKFVIADVLEDSVPPSLSGLVGADRRGLGFIVHEEDNGGCRWEYWGDHDDDLTEHEVCNYIEDYIDWLGNGWEAARGLGFTALILGIGACIWAFVFSCLAHIRPLRYGLGGISTLLLVAFQFSTFAVLNSNFCEDRNCTLGRSGGLTVAAGMFFFFAGVMFFFTKDYPGLVSVEEDMMKVEETATVEENVHEGTYAHTGTDEVKNHHDMEAAVVGSDGITDAQEVKPDQDEAAVLY